MRQLDSSPPTLAKEYSPTATKSQGEQNMYALLGLGGCFIAVIGIIFLAISKEDYKTWFVVLIAGIVMALVGWLGSSIKGPAFLNNHQPTTQQVETQPVQ